jgi:hypothetical protein
LPANKIGRQRRQSIDLTGRQAVFDRQVLAFAVSVVRDFETRGGLI